MAVNLSPLGGAGWQFFDNNGIPLVGGLLYTYAAGTTTPIATYTTSAGTVANSNPIVLNSTGRLTNEIWFTTGTSVKIILQTSSAVQIGSYDNLSGINDFAAIYSALAASNGSSLIGYNQGSTGAVTSNVQTKLQETVSVKDFGATGDGTTDDTAAIQAAVNYVHGLPNNQKPAIFFPAGRFLIKNTIQLYDNITLYGVDRDIGYTYSFNHSSEVVAGTALNAMFDVTGSNIYIGHLGLYGNTAANYALYSAGTYGRASSNTFEQLAITLCQITGIYLNNLGLTKIINCQISNCLQCGIDGVGFGDADIEGCYINTNNFDSTSTVNSPSSATVYGVGIRLRSDPTSGNQSGNINIRGGKIEFCRVGILINAAQGVNISGINFNVCRKASIYVASDVVPLPASTTTYSNTTATSIQITGNRFLGGLQGTQSLTSHILVTYARYVTIVGNGFKRVNDAAADFYGTYPTQGPDYGIWLYNAELCTVVGNNLYGSAITHELVVQNITAATALHTIYSNSYDGTQLVDAGTVVTQPVFGNINFVSGAGPIAINTAKAWVRFVASATPTLTSSYNVSSVTKVSSGTYNVNFTNALGNDAGAAFVTSNTGSANYSSFTNSSITVSVADGSEASVIIFNN